ncbi:hypothetical protein Fcan01_24213 [Folsomia candida]|uniref:Uncharacterized protein n=1 Tax=Folsomia candida TaxID=158441 RepID=A0A226D714_FOLCA|nr:hypothetical protein Fcan01_24213 [Folsomia candida]
MAELVALLSEIGVQSAGSHLHIVTDQENLDVRFPPELQIETPDTFYKITYYTDFFKQRHLSNLPYIKPWRVRPSAIVNMIVLLVVSPQGVGYEGSDNIGKVELAKLLHAFGSARNLILERRVASLFNKGIQSPTYFKGPFTLFWLTSWFPNTVLNFPSQTFFTRDIGIIERINVHNVHTVIFMVKLQEQADSSADSKIVYICAHCTFTPYVKFIPFGHIINRLPGIVWSSKIMLGSGSLNYRLTESIAALAPVQDIILKHSYNFHAYTTRCGNPQEQNHQFIKDLSDTEFFCGSNLTIHHLPFYFKNLTHKSSGV